MATREEMIRELTRRDMISQLQARDAKKKEEPDTINDAMPEWLQDGDRSVVKNLSNNNDEAISYLQKQYPDAEFKANGDDIIARKKGETAYGKLDPSGLEWNDIKDLGYDALQGVSEGVGAVMGAPGGIAGVMAGSAGGAGAANFLKQKLRQHYGLQDEFSVGDSIGDMAIGAAVPGVFHGAGKALKYGAQKTAPWAYSKLTGKSVPLLKRLAKSGDDIASRSSDEALAGIEALGEGFGDDIAKRQADIGAKYAALEKAGGSVDVKPIVKAVDDHIAELRRLSAENPSSGAFKSQLDDAIKFRTSEIGRVGYKPKKMKLEASQKLRNLLNDKYLPAYKEDVGQMVGKGVSGTEEKLANMVRAKLREQGDIATNGVLGNVNGEYSALNEMADFGRDYLGSPKKTLSTLKKIGEGADDELLGRLQRLPQELQDKLLDARSEKEVFDYLKGVNKKHLVTSENMGSQLADSVGGKSPVEKILGAAGLAGGYVTGGPVMGVAGGALGRGIGKLLASPKSALRITKAARAMGITTEELAAKMEKSPWLMQSILGATYAGAKK